MKLKVVCEDANHFCDKKQYKESNFWEKGKLYFHLLYCKACRDYSNNNSKLSEFLDKNKIFTITKSEKEILQQRVQRFINSQSKN
ncbi:hypothetical protein [Dokdonia sp. Hel_I_53]|uniref:hypothetical protein n=1 Tax=Dokdonia sp. Hel_I_53 TaxID=1566287 RepID=UPI00119A5F1D|nr:hypothetical protein [Dokdonia sp. Hel_I_53]TVZ53154.1 hypothetical protein OD90_2351 [Dokdonia sp. Hel_I_53]